MTQSIFFDVIARDKASNTFSRVGKASDSADSRLKKFGKTTAKLAGIAGVAGFGAGFVSFLKDSNAEAREAQKVGALTTQVIKSTGGAAGVTATHVGDLANAISQKVGIDDEAIQSGENLLLTFTRIRNEVGRGNKIFDQATQAVTDMSVALKQDMKSSAIQVGKALNDPIKGVTALQRVGVSFTADQKKQIKALVGSGKTLQAQKIILRELNREFGGAGKAQVTAADKAGVAWKNLEEQIGTALLPTVDKLATFVADDAVPAISGFVAGMQDGTGAGGEFASILKDTAAVGKTALKILDSLPGPVKKFGAEGLIAYVALGKLTSGMSAMGSSLAMPIARTKQFYAEMTYAETRMGKVKTASFALGGALKNVAGTAGMLAVVDGAQRSNKAVGLLESTLGGAAAGFAVAGPAGPYGAAAGAVLGLSVAAFKAIKNVHGLGAAARDGVANFGSWKDAIDSATGALNKQAEAVAYNKLQEQGLIDKGRLAGISSQLLVQAALGRLGAEKKVNAILREAAGTSDDWTSAMNNSNSAAAKKIIAANDLAGALGMSTESLHKQLIAEREAILAGKDYAKLLPGLKKPVVTAISTKGLEKSAEQIVGLTRKYNLTPKQITTILKAADVQPTKANIQAIIDKAKELQRQHPKPKMDVDTTGAKAKLRQIAGQIQGVLNLFSALSNAHYKSPGQQAKDAANAATHGGKSNRTANSAGRTFSSSYADGINFDSIKVNKALTRLERMSERTTSKLADLRSTRQDFLSTFQSDNLFGTDLSGGGGINSLLTFEQKQAQQASQLLSDIKTAASKGLSKSLISQLQAQGTSGAEQLHALAMGSTGQIQQLNALNAQTQASLQSAGMLAGNTVRGGNINADIAATARDERLIEKLIKRLDRMDGDIVIQIEGETIVRAIKKRNRKKGVASAGL